MTSCGWRTAITVATSNPARRAASNHMPDNAVIFGSLMTTSGAAGNVVRYALILATQAAFALASNAPSSCMRSVRSYPELPWRRRIAWLRWMAARGSQKPRGFSAVAPNSPAGSAAPHSERTRVSADVPDRP